MEDLTPIRKLYNNIQYNTIQYNTNNTIQYNTIQYNSIKYNTELRYFRKAQRAYKRAILKTTV